MKLEMFTVVRLKTGQEATIVEIFKNGEGYMVDIPLNDGGYEQEVVSPSDIASVFERVEKPFTVG